MSKKGHDQVLVTGGASVNSSFLKNGLVDEIVLNIEPTVVGKGIPLFAPEEFEVKLNLVETKELEGGVQQVTYSVQK